VVVEGSVVVDVTVDDSVVGWENVMVCVIVAGSVVVLVELKLVLV